MVASDILDPTNFLSIDAEEHTYCRCIPSQYHVVITSAGVWRGTLHNYQPMLIAFLAQLHIADRSIDNIYQFVMGSGDHGPAQRRLRIPDQRV